MNSKRILFLLIFHSSLFTLHSLLAQQYKVRSFCWERVEVTSELDAAPLLRLQLSWLLIE